MIEGLPVYVGLAVSVALLIALMLALLAERLTAVSSSFIVSPVFETEIENASEMALSELLLALVAVTFTVTVCAELVVLFAVSVTVFAVVVVEVVPAVPKYAWLLPLVIVHV